jgi:hypothetical protein
LIMNHEFRKLSTASFKHIKRNLHLLEKEHEKETSSWCRTILFSCCVIYLLMFGIYVTTVLMLECLEHQLLMSECQPIFPCVLEYYKMFSSYFLFGKIFHISSGQNQICKVWPGM